MKHISDMMSLAEITDHDFDVVAAEPSGRRKNLHDISGTDCTPSFVLPWRPSQQGHYAPNVFVCARFTGSAIPSRRSS
jgi:hypothetical protein